MIPVRSAFDLKRQNESESCALIINYFILIVSPKDLPLTYTFYHIFDTLRAAVCRWGWLPALVPGRFRPFVRCSGNRRARRRVRRVVWRVVRVGVGLPRHGRFMVWYERRCSETPHPPPCTPRSSACPKTTTPPWCSTCTSSPTVATF